MHRLFRIRPWTLALLPLLACKEPEVAAAENQAKRAQAALTEARGHLSSGQANAALAALSRAATAAPDNPEPHLLMAQAHRMAGNEGAAILALKQAASMSPGSDPTIQRQLADIYLQQGLTKDALAALITMRDAGNLPDADVLRLARIQAREGMIDAAFKTLESILRENPDDAEAKSVEAEVLWLKGDELLAANLMDRLLNQDPALASARLLRARYFLVSGFPDLAESDLNAVKGADAARPEVVTLRARVLLALGRAADAEEALRELVEAQPQNADALAWLAETVRVQGRRADAQSLVDQALQLNPGWPGRSTCAGAPWRSKGTAAARRRPTASRCPRSPDSRPFTPGCGAST